MPTSCAPPGFLKRTGRPSSVTVPRSGGKTSASMFINVDLPAPFSPSKALSRPRRTARLTPSSARTPGKDFVMPPAWSSTSSGAGQGPLMRIQPGQTEGMERGVAVAAAVGPLHLNTPEL